MVSGFLATVLRYRNDAMGEWVSTFIMQKVSDPREAPRTEMAWETQTTWVDAEDSSRMQRDFRWFKMWLRCGLPSGVGRRNVTLRNVGTSQQSRTPNVSARCSLNDLRAGRYGVKSFFVPADLIPDDMMEMLGVRSDPELLEKVSELFRRREVRRDGRTVGGPATFEKCAAARRSACSDTIHCSWAATCCAASCVATG